MKRYEFDVKCFANIVVEANTEDEAREKLRAGLANAGGDTEAVNFGCFPDGEPILGSVTPDDDEFPCEEQDPDYDDDGNIRPGVDNI